MCELSSIYRTNNSRRLESRGSHGLESACKKKLGLFHEPKTRSWIFPAAARNVPQIQVQSFVIFYLIRGSSQVEASPSARKSCQTMARPKIVSGAKNDQR